MPPREAHGSRREDTVAILERRNAELTILYETVRDLTSTLAMNQVLGRMLDRSLHHLDAEIGSILLLSSDERLRIIAARGLPEQVETSAEMRVGEGISGHVAASRRPLIVRDVESDPQFQRENHERYYTRSLLSAPLMRSGQVLGVININNKRNREPFVPDDLHLLEAIAGHASVALGNARQYEEALRRAQRDGLTGLANHGHFYATLELEVQRALRYGRPLALAMIDIDHFKVYNDRLGHRAGDEALLSVAETIASASRSHDLVARYGGEEFAVLLPETSLEGAITFGEKIRQAVETSAFGPGGRETLTVSVGVSLLPENDRSAGALVDAADARLYRAKSGGRNRVCAAP